MALRCVLPAGEEIGRMLVFVANITMLNVEYLWGATAAIAIVLELMPMLSQQQLVIIAVQPQRTFKHVLVFMWKTVVGQS